MSRSIDRKEGLLRVHWRDFFFLVGWALYFAPPIMFHLSGMMTKLIRFGGLAYAALLVFCMAGRGFRLQRRYLKVVGLMALLSIWEMYVVLTRSPGQLVDYAFQILFPPMEVFILIVYSLYGSRDQGERLARLTPLYWLSSIYIVGNLLSMLAFPSGIIRTELGSSVARANWLLGSKNNQTNYLVLSGTIALMYTDARKKRVRGLMLVCAAFIEALFTDENGLRFMGGSSTGIVAMALIVMVAAVNLVIKEIKLLRIGVRWVYLAALFMDIVLISGTTVPAIQSIVVNVLHKTPTFSNRTFIWERVLYYISKQPVAGYGEREIWFFVSLSNKLSGTSYTYNLFLKIILDFGIVGLVLFSVPFLCARRGKNKQYGFLITGFFGIMLSGLMNEVCFEFPFVFLILIEAMAAGERTGYLKII